MAKGKRGNPAKAAITAGINRYLNDVEAGAVDGKAVVHLGAIGNGLPRITSDPTEVERAIKVVKEQARTGSAVQRLERQQRVITLTRQLEELSTEGDDSNETFFVENALAWATERGVGYAAFRVMGVPAAVLREAGITRGFEP